MLATEKRFIDANALKETVTTDYYEHFTRYHDTDQIALIDMVCDDIEEAPTVDAVEVVRCKDCEFWNDGWFPECTMGKCKRGKPVLTGPHHYCSYGVRRLDVPAIIKDESFVVKEDE